MVRRTATALTDLYLRDETAWLEAMADLISRRQVDELDLDHLQEYLADMAKRDRREVKSRLTVLAAHVLKWLHQKKNRTRGWRQTIVSQRQELEDLLVSKTLRNHSEAILAEAY